VPWSTYSGTLGAERPAFLPPIADPEGCAKVIASGLDWMRPIVTMTADSFEISLRMDAPSAEAALHHMRGSLKSALHTAGIPVVGNWPLTVLKVEPSSARGHMRMPARDPVGPRSPLPHD
jgi:hypothetical protein